MNDIDVTAFDLIAEAYDAMIGSSWDPKEEYRRLLSAYVSLLPSGGEGAVKVLDVGCGTGRSSEALADLGFHVTGVDTSRSMLEHARVRARERSERKPGSLSFQHEIPGSGDFDAAFAVSDVLNYFLTPEQLFNLFYAVAAALRPTSCFVFDAKTPAIFARGNIPDRVYESAGTIWTLSNSVEPDFAPGGSSRGLVRRFKLVDTGPLWNLTERVFLERHHSIESLVADAAGAGMRLKAVRSLTPAGDLVEFDEARPRKAIVALSKQ